MKILKIVIEKLGSRDVFLGSQNFEPYISILNKNLNKNKYKLLNLKHIPFASFLTTKC